MQTATGAVHPEKKKEATNLIAVACTSVGISYEKVYSALYDPVPKDKERARENKILLLLLREELKKMASASQDHGMRIAIEDVEIALKKYSNVDVFSSRGEEKEEARALPSAYTKLENTQSALRERARREAPGSEELETLALIDLLGGERLTAPAKAEIPVGPLGKIGNENWEIYDVRVYGDRTVMLARARLDEKTTIYAVIGTEATSFLVEHRHEGQSIWFRLSNTNGVRGAAVYDEQTRKWNYHIAVDTDGRYQLSALYNAWKDILVGLGYDSDNRISLQFAHKQIPGLRFVVYKDEKGYQLTFRADDLSRLWTNDPSLRVRFITYTDSSGKTYTSLGLEKRIDENRSVIFVAAGDTWNAIYEVRKGAGWVRLVAGRGIDKPTMGIDMRDAKGGRIFNLSANFSGTTLERLATSMLFAVGDGWSIGPGAILQRVEGETELYPSLTINKEGINFILYKDKNGIQHRISVDDLSALSGSKDPTLRVRFFEANGQLSVGVEKRLDEKSSIILFVNEGGSYGIYERRLENGGYIWVRFDTEGNIRANVRKVENDWEWRIGADIPDLSRISAAVLKHMGSIAAGIGYDSNGINIQVGLRKAGINAIFFRDKDGKIKHRISVEDIASLTGDKDPTIRASITEVTDRDGKTRVYAGIEKRLSDEDSLAFYFADGRTFVRYRRRMSDGTYAEVDIKDSKFYSVGVREWDGRNVDYYVRWANADGFYGEMIKHLRRGWSVGGKYGPGGFGLMVTRQLIDNIEGVIVYDRNGLSYRVRLADYVRESDPTTRYDFSFDSRGNVSVHVGKRVENVQYDISIGKNVGIAVYDMGGKWRAGVTVGGERPNWYVGYKFDPRGGIIGDLSVDRGKLRAHLWKQSGDFAFGVSYPLGISLGVRGPGNFPVPLLTYSKGAFTFNWFGAVLLIFGIWQRHRAKEKARRMAEEVRQTFYTVSNADFARAEYSVGGKGRITLDRVMALLPKPTEIAEKIKGAEAGTIVISQEGKDLVRLQVATPQGMRTYILTTDNAKQALQGVFGNADMLDFSDGVRQITLAFGKKEDGTYELVVDKTRLTDYATVLTRIKNAGDCTISISKTASGDARVTLEYYDVDHGMKRTRDYLVKLEDLDRIGIFKENKVKGDVENGNSVVLEVKREGEAFAVRKRVVAVERRDALIDQLVAEAKSVREGGRGVIQFEHSEDGSVLLMVKTEKGRTLYHLRDDESALALYKLFGAEFFRKANSESARAEYDAGIGAVRATDAFLDAISPPIPAQERAQTRVAPETSVSPQARQPAREEVAPDPTKTLNQAYLSSAQFQNRRQKEE